MHNFGSVSRAFIVAAAVVIVLAGIKAASNILVLLLLAVFIAVVIQPLMLWFKKKGAPTVVAVSAVIVFISIVGFFISLLVVQSVNDFMLSFPAYRAGMLEQTQWLMAQLKHFNIDIHAESWSGQLAPERLMSVFLGLLSGLGGMMTNSFLVLLIIIFILAEAAYLPQKISLAFKRADSQLNTLSELIQSINKYLALKTMISLVTGALVGCSLWVLGIEHALLWAVLAFLLNFIPNIGSILAAIPAILMALIQVSPAMAGLVAFVYLVVNMLMGNLVEPRLMGQRLGLSTLVVFLSLIFWGWLLGPVGMLLSVPLTMVVKISLQVNPDTRWLAILLSGDEVIHTATRTKVEPE